MPTAINCVLTACLAETEDMKNQPPTSQTPQPIPPVIENIELHIKEMQTPDDIQSNAMSSSALEDMSHVFPCLSFKSQRMTSST